VGDDVSISSTVLYCKGIPRTSPLAPRSLLPIRAKVVSNVYIDVHVHYVM
jgi:hypothetical protein